MIGGNRARGALATLALATVVLVAVVVAGTVSMAPLGDNWTADYRGPDDRDSFEIVEGVVVPRSPSETEPPGSPNGDNRNDDSDPGDVDVAGDLDPQDPSGGLVPGAGPLDPIPPGPIVTDPVVDPPIDPPDPTDPTDPVDPVDPIDPIDPVGPIVPPTEPPIDYPPPPDRTPSGHVSDPQKKHKPNARSGKRGKHAQPGKKDKQGKQNAKRRNRGKSPVVIVHGPRGPKWRPSGPARQLHPQHRDKWSRAERHPRQQAGPASQRHHQSVSKAPGKRRAAPSRPQVRNRGGDRDRGSASSPRKHGKQRHGRHRGHGKNKRGRR